MSPHSPTLSNGEMSSREQKGMKVHDSASTSVSDSVNGHPRREQFSRTSRPGSNMRAHQTDADPRDKYGHDRPARQRSRSPYRASRPRSRSPYRAGREPAPEKRRYDEDHYGRHSSDSRRHKPHYERDSRRNQASNFPHKDPDRPNDRSNYTYDRGSDYNRRYPPARMDAYHSSSRRERSRSPFSKRHERPSPGPHDANQIKEREGGSRDQRPRGSTPFSQLESTPKALQAQSEAKPTSPKPDFAAPIEAVEQSEKPPLSDEELTAFRRKRREEIRAKYKAEDELLRVKALEAATQLKIQSEASTPAQLEHSQPPSPLATDPPTPHDGSAPATPLEFTIENADDLVERQDPNTASHNHGASAADFDPTELDEERLAQESARFEPSTKAGSAIADEAKPVKEFDMFADDISDDEMFRQLDASKRKPQTLHQGMMDDWDLPDGHYRVIPSELLDHRYNVLEQIGKGAFGIVVRARDITTSTTVAIKIARNNDTMLKAGKKEIKFLTLLNDADPDDKKHVIRFHRDFMHKRHLCLVFEHLNFDLRNLLKSIGKNVGFRLGGIKAYAQQMFIALEHMRKQEVLHADLKPDNILVNESPHNLIKLCDFGTAIKLLDVIEPTPQLVSRFYRAPEIILGIKYDSAIDMWSIGCTLFELYTDDILFKGANNNAMLLDIQLLRQQKIPQRMIKKAALADEYFDDEYTYYSEAVDPMTRNAFRKPVNFKTITAPDLKTRLAAGVQGGLASLSPTELRDHNAFADLLDKCLLVDPEKRIKPKDALYHHFFTGTIANTRAGHHGR